MSASVRPNGRQPTRLPGPWDSPGKNTGVGCHFLLQCMKVKSESEVTQSCPTLRDPMDCRLPGSSIHGIFQARVLEWGATAFSASSTYCTSFLGQRFLGFFTPTFFFSYGFVSMSPNHLAPRMVALPFCLLSLPDPGSLRSLVQVAGRRRGRGRGWGGGGEGSGGGWNVFWAAHAGACTPQALAL